MKNNNRIFLLIFFYLLTNPAMGQDRDISNLSSGGVLKPLQAIMDIRHYTLSLDVDVQQQAINGYVEIDLILSQSTDTLLFDLVHLLTVKSIACNNQKRSFYQKNDLIYITDKDGFKQGKQKIKIEYGGKPPVAAYPPWEGGFTWTKDNNSNPWVVINCQIQGAKIYYPCKDHPSDEPNEGADLIITVPKGLVVAGPGLLQSTQDSGKAKVTYHWKTNYTISNYCIVFNIGKYVVASHSFTSTEGHKVPMQFYVLEQDTAHAAHLLALKERDTRILEKYFGEYPWIKEKIGVAEVPNPGMEHQTMVTYGDQFNYTLVGGQDYSENLFHEYSHEWWANKVTNKDWAHMWIQEGIATYAEALFFREAAGENAYDSVMFFLGTKIKNDRPLVQGDAIDVQSTYTGDIYVKGAFFMHTLRYVLGDTLFFNTLKKLATDSRFTYDNFITSDDVEQLFSSQLGKSLKPLFDFYLRTTSKLEIVISHTALNIYTVKIKNFSMPLPVDIVTSEGILHTIISATAKEIKSSTPPLIDTKGHYLKTVLLQ